MVMGVAGSGKSTVGTALAQELGWEFSDADDFHSVENRAKMTAGVPLTDADRAPWLAALRNHIEQRARQGVHVVIACSALKDSYRAQITPPAPLSVQFVFLSASPELTAARLRNRHHHFMKENMLASQFATLEAPSPQEALIVDASHSVEEIVRQVIGQLPES